jgi:hypothetical protein
MRLTERVSIVASGANGFGLTHPADCHVYVIDGDKEAALVDAGAGVDVRALLNGIERSGVPADRVRRLFIDSLRHLGERRFEGFFPGHRTFSVTDGQRHLRAALDALDRGVIPPTFR